MASNLPGTNPLYRPTQGPNRFSGAPGASVMSGRQLPVSALRIPNPLTSAPPAAPQVPLAPIRQFSPEGLHDRVSTRIPTAAGLPFDPHSLTGDRALSIGRHTMIPEGFWQRHAGSEGLEAGRGRVAKGMATAAQAIRDRYGFVNAHGLSDPAVLERFIEHGRDNLRFLWDNAMQRPWAPLAADWYRRGANGLAHKIADSSGGRISTRQAAGALAALSPSTDWNQNATMAERLAPMHLAEAELKVSPKVRGGNQGFVKANPELGIWANGGTHQASGEQFPAMQPGMRLADLRHPMQRAMFARAYDEMHNPDWRKYDIFSPSGDRIRAKTKAGDDKQMKWQSFDNIAKAMRILQHDDLGTISRSLGGAHKVRNFYNNIVSPDAAAYMPWEHADFTGDTHHINATMLHPLGSNHPIVTQGMQTAPKVAATGSTGLYGLHADAGRRAAKDIAKDTRRIEYLPNQVQSVTWEGVRNLFAKQHKKTDNAGNPLHEVGQVAHGAHYAVRHGFMSPQHAREIIMRTAGGIKDPDWWSGVASDEEE